MNVDANKGVFTAVYNLAIIISLIIDFIYRGTIVRCNIFR